MQPEATHHTKESQRLDEDRKRLRNWKRWGPYLSERQWATVREDYSENGTCWDYFPHDHARSRAYRWGEDGLLGFTDRECRLCFALALWNGRDPILKERLFGLTGPEGNHGEDVKELYYYLDSTPTHSWMRALYKYPQAPFPYAELAVRKPPARTFRQGVRARSTRAFSTEGRYFDVQAEYAKRSPDHILIRLTVSNRGPEPATLHLLPTLWFRNLWTWGCTRRARLGKAGAQARRARRRSPSTTRPLATSSSASPRLPGEPPAGPVHRKRDQQPAALGRRQRLALRQRRLSPACCRRGGGAVNPAQRGPRRPFITGWRFRPAEPRP